MSKIDTGKIKEITNDLIGYELYKRKEIMKKNKLKHLGYAAIAVVVLAGGVVSVDALTDNSISNTIKNTLSVKVNDKDYNAKCTKNEKGVLVCNLDSEVLGEGNEATFEISEEYIDGVSVDASDGDLSISIDKVIEKAD
ncbi:MAG: hypothetical protein K2J20_02190 [Bacilli bacterium]|nr:hypothetical protein [Bacilli bacterium]